MTNYTLLAKSDLILVFADKDLFETQSHPLVYILTMLLSQYKGRIK